MNASDSQKDLCADAPCDPKLCGCKRAWCTTFLAHLAESSNVKFSAEKAGVSTARAYQLRRENPTFAKLWLSALAEGYVHLEMEVLGRLRGDQSSDPKESKYDFANAIRLLNAHRDNAARGQAVQRNVSAAEVRASIDRKVEAIRSQIQQTKRRGQSKK